MKRLTILLTALLTAALCAAPALAANRVETLTTDVALRADGSAHVTQVFSADTAEGTEFYVDRMDSGCLTYSRFAVSDENGPYAVLPDGRWDIDASFDEKAGKCGLLEIDGGVELCWGITEYGRHDYTVSYDIGGLAGGLFRRRRLQLPLHRPGSVHFPHIGQRHRPHGGRYAPDGRDLRYLGLWL